MSTHRGRADYMRLRAWLARVRLVVRTIGVVAGARFFYIRKMKRGHPRWILPRGLAHPVLVRPGTSDVDAFEQVFIDRQYGCLDGEPDVRVIVDCGANVGYASVYLLSRHAAASLIAVEPVEETVAVLRRNLAAYGARARIFHAAVWSHHTPLSVSREAFRDGRDWARQVCAADPGLEVVQGWNLAALLEQAGIQHVSILKMDIEGAEAVVFASDTEGWLPRVNTLAVELHDDATFGDATSVFHHTLDGAGFDIAECGELRVCRRPRYPASPPTAPHTDRTPAGPSLQ